MKKTWFLVIAIILVIIIINIFLFVKLKPETTGLVIKDTLASTNVVTKVIDGDTVVIQGESTRLIGMDTDERGYPCYTEAKKRIEELILGKEVTLETDGEDKDQYQRYLRYIFFNNKNINLQLVEEGLAVARFYPKNQKYKQEILDAENYAKKNKIGCKWKDPEEPQSKPKDSETTQTETDESNTDQQTTSNNNNNDNSNNNNNQNSEYICDSNHYNCGDFTTHEQSQAVLEACGKEEDIHRLDRDEDGLACETLP